MVRILFFIWCIGTLGTTWGQALKELNVRYGYPASGAAPFQIHAVKTGATMHIYYTLNANSGSASSYMVAWEKRRSFKESSGEKIDVQDSVTYQDDQQVKGAFQVAIEEKPWLLVARVTDTRDASTQVYVQIIESAYPVNGWLEQEGQVFTGKHLPVGSASRVFSPGNDRMYVAYYPPIFPAAYPPYNIKRVKRDGVMNPVASFALAQGDSITFDKTGLYLFQADTLSAEGFAVRVVDEAFPRYTTVEGIARPIQFLCTTDERAALSKAQGDKAMFDRVVLDMVRDQNRAKRLIRNYFRRVTAANRLFSSYKPGWKTDRGMMYIIFGPPDEVHLTAKGEEWNYFSWSLRFFFQKRGSIFDPNYVVLRRDPRFRDPWFNAVDGWRRSRL